MSNGINKVILIGHIGANPELRATAAGEAVANFNVATSESFKNKQTGVAESRTEWHRVTAFGRIAEVVRSYCKKGSKIYVEGSNRTRKWEKQGVTMYTTEIVCSSMQLLSSDGQRNNEQNTSHERPESDSFDDGDISF